MDELPFKKVARRAVQYSCILSKPAGGCGAFELTLLGYFR